MYSISPMWVIGFLLVAGVAGLVLTAVGLYLLYKNNQGFKNWFWSHALIIIISSIIGLDVLLMITGLACCFFGLFLWWPLMLLGFPIGLAGVILLAFGLQDFDPDEYKCGALTFFDNIIKYDTAECSDHTVPVTGLTVLLWPIVGAVEVDLRNVELIFDAEVYSTEPANDPDGNNRSIPMKGKIAITVRPNKNDLFDYIRAGKMEKIKTQLRDIVINKVQWIVREKLHMSMMQIAERGYTISDWLRPFLVGGTLPDGTVVPVSIFDEKDFGLDLIKCQAEFPVPEATRKALIDADVAKIQAAARQTITRGDIASAVLLKTQLDIRDGRDAVQSVALVRQLENRDAKRIQIEKINGGNADGGDVNVTNLHMGNLGN